MEPPLKRQRLSTTVESEDDLHERRVRNDLQLKSRFETIFEKYSKDFEGIGDEIDMRTGEIVVNNGHILGMMNERDVGDAETSSGELESGCYSEDEDSPSLDGYNGSRNTILKPADLGDAVVISQAELTWRSDDDGDSLMGEIDVERQADEEIIESWGKAASDLEEDELANSEFEWMNPRHIRAVAHDRWQTRKQQLESLDEPSIDPAWRAPPLPESTLSLNVTKKASSPGVGDNQGESDSEARRISIWAPEEMQGQRRISTYQSIPNEQREHPRESLSGSNNPVQSSRPHLWAPRKKDRLPQFKATETMESRDMEPYFPQQNEQSMALHQSYMVRHNRTETTANPIPYTERLLHSTLPSASPFRAGEKTNQQPLLPESSSRQHDAKLTEQPPRGATPVIIEQRTTTDAPITRSIESSVERLVHPCESLQRARVTSNFTSLQLMSDGIQSRFAGTHQQNEEQLENFDPDPEGDCKYESASDHPATTSIPHVRSVAQMCEFDEEIAHLQVEIEKEDMHIEKLPQQPDRALATAATAVNVRQNSLARLGQYKRRPGRPRLAGSTELHLIEDVPAILKRKGVQNLTAHGFDVISLPNGIGGEHQSRPIDDDSTLSTMSPETTDAMQTPQVAASVTPLSRNPTDGPALVPQLKDTHSTECLAREEAPTTEPGACDAISEQNLQHTSRFSAKAHTVQVVIPVLPTCISEEAMQTVDYDLDKPRTGLKEDNGHLTTSHAGEMPRHLLRQSTSSGGIESKHQLLPILGLDVDHSTKRDAQFNRAQSDLEDPLCTEIPDSQPWSRSSLTLESPRKQGTKATKMSATFPQRPQHSNKAVHNSLISPKRQRKKPVESAIADSFSSISEAMLSCSEDELSFM